MIILSCSRLSAHICFALTLTMATSGADPVEKTPLSESKCRSPYSFPYVDSAHGFKLCLPAKVKKDEVAGYPAGSVVFSGFAVPANTNLRAKQLIIVPGNYDMIESATAMGDFTTHDVTFKRMKAEEGSAGHLTVHIIYTWKRGRREVHFDFADRSVNVANFDPSVRPAEYNRAAQVKLADEIMSTFTRLH